MKYEIELNSLGDRFGVALKLSKMSLKDLAVSSGVNVVTMGNWLKNTNRPSVKNGNAVADAIVINGKSVNRKWFHYGTGQVDDSND